MSFPERLHKALTFSQCPKYVHECPLCRMYVEKNCLDAISSETSKRIPLGKFNLCRDYCGSVFYNMAGVTYVACLMLQDNNPHFPKGTPVEFFHSNYDEYQCGRCEETFRLFMPAIEIPAPYVSEFSVVPCLFEALRKRKRNR